MSFAELGRTQHPAERCEAKHYSASARLQDVGNAARVVVERGCDNARNSERSHGELARGDNRTVACMA